jgi:hypothetical protein
METGRNQTMGQLYTARATEGFRSLRRKEESFCHDTANDQ